MGMLTLLLRGKVVVPAILALFVAHVVATAAYDAMVGAWLADATSRFVEVVGASAGTPTE